MTKMIDKVPASLPSTGEESDRFRARGIFGYSAAVETLKHVLSGKTWTQIDEWDAAKKPDLDETFDGFSAAQIRIILAAVDLKFNGTGQSESGHA